VDREAELIRSFHREYVDGFIIVSNNPSSKEIAQLRKERIPFVFSINDIHSVAKDPLVTYNNYEMAYAATKYLVDLGHKRFGYIAGLFGESDRPQARFNGFERALRDNGIRFYKKHFVIGGSYSSEAGFLSCRKLFSLRGEKPTALFCANDLIAVGAMHALRLHGIAVPGDVSIVGFDNIQPSAYVAPPLTTIGVNISDVGYESARLLFKLMDGEKLESNQITIKGRLIVRESCAPVT
jgi:LacI family transcriptional regulator